jgi:hypothetical protein
LTPCMIWRAKETAIFLNFNKRHLEPQSFFASVPARAL